MNKSALLSIALTTALATSLAGCKKKNADEDNKPAPNQPAPAPASDLPFKGTYTKYAEATWKNGQRIRTANADGNATMLVDHGRVVYKQAYNARGKLNRVTQTYTFSPQAVKPVMGGYDVALVFQGISGDTQNYNPDSRSPKLEARKKSGSGGWEIGLITTDSAGIMGGVEFR